MFIYIYIFFFLHCYLILKNGFSHRVKPIGSVSAPVLNTMGPVAWASIVFILSLFRITSSKSLYICISIYIHTKRHNNNDAMTTRTKRTQCCRLRPQLVGKSSTCETRRRPTAAACCYWVSPQGLPPLPLVQVGPQVPVRPPQHSSFVKEI